MDEDSEMKTQTDPLQLFKDCVRRVQSTCKQKWWFTPASASSQLRSTENQRETLLSARKDLTELTNELIPAATTLTDTQKIHLTGDSYFLLVAISLAL